MTTNNDAVNWDRDSNDPRERLRLEDEALMREVAWVRSVDRAFAHYQQVTASATAGDDVADLLREEEA